MKTRLATPWILCLLCACSSDLPVGPSPTAIADGGALTPDGDDGEPGRRALGIVVIDVQSCFVGTAVNKDIDAIIDNTRQVLDLAGKSGTRLFITFEASKDDSTGHGLPAKLKSAVPAHALELIKTTFAATGLAAFVAAVKQADLTHLVVLGAETDVCVLQTVLGLRSLGYTVILQQDAVFSEEPNVAPALRRMKQAGVLLAGMAQVRRYIEDPSQLPPPAPPGPVKIIKPLAIAATLNHLDAATSDPLAAQKRARLRELLLISEWFDMPLYGTTSALPASLSGLIKQPIRPLAELAQNQAIEQVVIAGTDLGLTDLVGAETHDVFLVEDGLLDAGTGDQAAMLEGLYQGGAVPITYKSLYYEMTQSVDLDQWPSKAWVARDPEYYYKTRAPESLPPIVK